MAILSKVPEGASVLDLAPARAARAEARAESGAGNPLLKLAVGFVELRPEICVEAAALLAEGNLRGGLGMLLADPSDLDAIFNEGLTKEDVHTLTVFISGLTPGE